MGRRQREDAVMSDYVRERLARLVAEIRAPAGSDEQATVLRPHPDRQPPEPPRIEPSQTDQSALEPPTGEAEPGPVGGPGRRFTRTHLLVLAVVLLLGALVAGYALTRARAIQVAEPLPIQTTGPTGPAPVPAPISPPGPPAASPSPASVRIHVVGEVTRPGVHTLPAGARVIDAITAAGGFTPAARPGELNLAQVLSDGQQVLVGGGAKPGGEVRGGGAASGASAGPAGAKAPGGKINLNAATLEQFDALPGVGPVTAQKIVAWRTQHGRFTRIEELQEVPGIGPKSYADLAPLVTV